MMLPYLEQTAVYSSINFYYCGGYNYGWSCNSTGYTTVINAFLCPSDGNVGTQRPSQYGLPNINSYRGSIGTTTATYAWGPGYSGCQPDPYNFNGYGTPGNPGCSPYSTGVFVYWACFGIRDVTDGTSNTIAFSEGLVGDQANSPNTRNNAIEGVGSITVAEVGNALSLPTATLITALNACTQAYKSGGGTSAFVNNNQSRWGYGGMTHTLFNTVVPPNSKQWPWNACTDSCAGCQPEPSTFANAQSNHSGGCNVLMSDGSVRFIKDSINQITWMQIGTRAGNEVVDANSF